MCWIVSASNPWKIKVALWWLGNCRKPDVRRAASLMPAERKLLADQDPADVGRLVAIV
jgi:hypothetical protein